MSDCCCPVCGSNISQMEGLRIVSEEKMIFGKGRVSIFTPTEWDIVEYLINKNGGVASIDAIHHWLYQLRPDGGADTRIIAVMLTRIRKKIKGLGLNIQNVWGQGYRLTRDKS